MADRRRHAGCTRCSGDCRLWLSNGVLPDLALFGEVDYLGAIGALAALALWIATYGFGEEVGWRGFAFHRMEGGGWVQAAVMIGVLWGLYLTTLITDDKSDET